MNINTFEKLQLNEVKELIKNYCVSSLGKELIEKTNPSGNFNIVKRRLNENKVALFSLVMIVIIILFAIFGPILIEKLYGFTY